MKSNYSKLLFTLFLFVVCLVLYLFNRGPETVSSQIKAVVLGLPIGEYDYETKVIYDDKAKPINVAVPFQKTPIIVTTLDYLDKAYPKIEKVEIAICWYVDSVNAGEVSIVPKVEKRFGPDWEVAGYNRSTAKVMSREEDGLPNWSATQTDRSMVQLAQLLHSKGIDVTIYPLVFVDDKTKSWRGLINAKSQHDIDNFFLEYEKFILHYVKLQYEGVYLKDVIKGFVIGSELEKLLRYKDIKNEFPAVQKMINLASKVREEIGYSKKILYAANWSEYHSDDDGWYYLDDLWANKNIDYVGINAYFPLTSYISKEKKNYDYIDIRDGWTKGEYYDYDTDSTGKKMHVSPEHAAKNLQKWWESEHINPDFSKTKWAPKMKPIVFTEIGFIPLHKTTDAPYKFVDEYSKNFGLPLGSNGMVNNKYQYDAIKGTIEFLNSVKWNFSTRKMIKDAYWYNIDPNPNNYDEIYNHEIKVRKYEDLSDDQKQIQDRNIKEIIKNNHRNN